MINRNNYEEYLLMYLDGELSSQQCKDVALFIQQHPDLQQEFELLRQTVLQPEELMFEGKASLYRKETGITLSNYQDYFLFYIDNELSTADKEMVETFVLQQPQLQEEFTLLKQTVLPSEELSFGNKEILYRREEKRRPVVISMRWASLAAAVMIGVIVLFMFSRNGDTGQLPQVASGEKHPTQAPVKVTPPVETVIPAIDEQDRNTPTVAGVNNSTGNKKQSLPLNGQVRNDVQQEIEVTNRQQDHQLAINKPNETAVTNITGNVTVPAVVSLPGETKVIAAGSGDNNNYYVQPAVYTETLEAEEDKTVYVGSIQVNPDKVRGFFRKATRFITSKVKSDDDNDRGKVRVANIEMNKIR